MKNDELHNEGEIVIYHPDESIRLEVRLEQETVWLTQAQMTELFHTTKQNVSLHISNIFKEGELDRKLVVKESLTTTQHGAMFGKVQHTKVLLYNLDVIISVGYRVKNPVGTRFRQWANQVLKNYLLRGYAIHQQLVQMEARLDNKILLQHDEIKQNQRTSGSTTKTARFLYPNQRAASRVARPMANHRRPPLPLRALAQREWWTQDFCHHADGNKSGSGAERNRVLRVKS